MGRRAGRGKAGGHKGPNPASTPPPPLREGVGEGSRQGKGGRPQGPQPRIHAAPAPTRESFVRLVRIERSLWLLSGTRTRYFARGEGGKEPCRMLVIY